MNTRVFVSQDLAIKTWADLENYFTELKSRKVSSIEDFKRWLKDRSELESVISEDLAWRYVRMTCDTENKEKVEAYTYFVSEIEPQISPVSNTLDEIALASQFKSLLTGKEYEIMFRSIEKNTQIFREENVPILSEIAQEAQKYGSIAGKMTVVIDGEEVTLAKASDKLQSTNREERNAVYHKINDRRLQDSEELNNLFNHLISLRNRTV